MRRYALAPAGPTEEQVLVAVPHRAAEWTIAAKNRGMHRMLVPIDGIESLAALRYILGEPVDHLAAIHLVNVQRPLMVGDVTPLVDARTVMEVRRTEGERALRKADALLGEGVVPVTREVAFGKPAETLCRIAEERGCTGIVMGVGSGFELADLIAGSLASRVLRQASVPVTIVNRRTATASKAAPGWEGIPVSRARASRETPSSIPAAAEFVV